MVYRPGCNGVVATRVAPTARLQCRVLAFGPFTLDLRTYVLSKDGAMVPLSPKLVQVLACLAEARGELVTRELLLDRYWPSLTVTDNTLTRALADIRKVLDDNPATPDYIQTLARRGYRFVAPVRSESAVPDAAQVGIVAITPAFSGLEPFIAWERGRTALESLSVGALPEAAEAFSRAVTGAPQYAPAHAGLANAHVFRYEATRVDNEPDLEALTAAIGAATRATTLDPTMGEGWAALGHALANVGRGEDARAALRQALALEPRNWRHHYRMAVCAWGEERLRAVERAEALLPGFAGTQILSAMVLIARQAFDFARDAAGRGAAAQATQHDHTLYPGNGLLWLRGLTAAARGQRAAALDDFRAEAIFSTHATTVYAREGLVLSREAEGFTLLGLGDAAGARGAFAEANAASPGHARALLGLAVADGASGQAVERVAAACATLAQAGKHGEHALVVAAAQAWAGDADAGVAHAEGALTGAWADSTGWSLPADPMFAPLRGAPGYPRLLARLSSRAS